MSETNRYAVIGNPIEHSISPWVHQQFARQTQQEIDYQKIKAPINAFADTVGTFFAQGGKGLNITLPFKEQAYQFARYHSEISHQVKAVNTLVLNDEGVVEGHNTDGIGLTKDLQNNCAINLTGQRILILGAGGATRGIIPALFESGVSHITIANRTLVKAEMLRDDFAKAYPIEVHDLNQLTTIPNISSIFDGMINATSASLKGETIPLPDSLSVQWAYDLAYGSQRTPFVTYCAERGIAHIFDGLGMLVEQAAESFLLWRQIRPNSQTVIPQLRKYLAN